MIWLENAMCQGTESSLFGCAKNPSQQFIVKPGIPVYKENLDQADFQNYHMLTLSIRDRDMAFKLIYRIPGCFGLA
jgi:hypothetical protein